MGSPCGPIQAIFFPPSEMIPQNVLVVGWVTFTQSGKCKGLSSPRANVVDLFLLKLLGLAIVELFLVVLEEG